MKIFRILTGNALLLAALIFGTGGGNPPLLSFNPSRGNERETNQTTVGYLQDKEACKEPFIEHEIPDDGSWLTVCWNDPSAPLESTVIKTSVKYEVDHPDPSQLEVQLVHDGVQEPVVLWNDRKAAEGVEAFGEAVGLETFTGSPGAGNWYLQVRDTVAGNTGKLTGMTIHNTYFLEGLMPVPEGVEGVEASAMRLPPDAVPSSAPDLDPPKKEIQGSQDIKSETFEGAFPNSNWTLYDYSSDGYNRLWDDANSRSHNGSWAGWPANGGADFIDPVINPVYPPNMDSWMIYGPFDLSDAATAETVFWLWRQMQATYDYLYVGISDNGVNYQGNFYYGNNSQVYNWAQYSVSMDDYAGDSSVWVAWRFYSNSSVQYEGPWVDDIVIRKEAPGYVTVNGTLTYQDRDNSTKNGRHTSVALYEDDPGGTDDFLAITSTNGSGYYSFPPILNWDADGDAANRNLDLYVVFEAMYFDNENAGTYHAVRDSFWEPYIWEDPTKYSNTSSGVRTINLNINDSNFNAALRAMWMLQDLRRAWQYIYNQSAPYYIDPGSVDAVWEHGLQCYDLGCNAYSIPGYLFVPDTQSLSADIVVHETGHRYLINANGLYSYGFCPNPHSITEASNTFCAYNEGWPNFLAIAANLELSGTDVCYDFGALHCGAGSINLETLPASADTDDVVEGRVAGALLDLLDSANEGYDSASFGFNEIAKIALQGEAENQFSDFWYYWKDNNFEKHHAVRAIFQNTINYNSPPVLSLPDWSVPHDSSWPNAFNLLPYVWDEESAATYMTWQIYSVSDTRCGVSIDAQNNVDILPQTQWTGSCGITIRANDTISNGYDTFTVHVTQASFADVPDTHSVYAQIESVFSAGITTGCASNPRRYCPSSYVDRGQMAAFLLRGIHGGGYTPPPASGTMFLDVPISHQFAAWIEELANEGITSGCGGGNYCPSSNVTRAQMAVFLLRSEHGSSYTPPPATGSMFGDVPLSHPFAAWIEQLANEGITSGCGGGNFCPNNPVTRAQMAVFLVNTFNLP